MNPSLISSPPALLSRHIPHCTTSFRGTAACAAVLMSFTTSCGWETIATWFVGTSTVVGTHAPGNLQEQTTQARPTWYLRASHHPPRSLIPPQKMNHQKRETARRWPLLQDDPDA